MIMQTWEEFRCEFTSNICSSVKKLQKPSIIRMASEVPAMMRSNLLFCCSSIVGFMIYSPLINPTLTPITALLSGISAKIAYFRVHSTRCLNIDYAST